MGLRGVVAACVIACLASGCTVFAIAGTKKEPLGEISIDVRPTGRRADLTGASCYVDRRQRVTSRIEIPNRAIFAGLGLLEALVGTIVYGEGSQNDAPLRQLGGGAMIADGLIAIVYTFWRQGKVVTSDHWVQTSETTTCAF